MIREETRAAIATQITSGVVALGATLYRWPNPREMAPTRVVIRVTEIEGTTDIPTFQGAGQPLRATDTWRFDIDCRAEADLQRLEDAAQLAQDLATAVLQGVHNNSALDGLDKSAPGVGRWLLLHAIVIRVVGPEVFDEPQGIAAHARVTVEMKAELFP
jgi:hypothetical protein